MSKEYDKEGIADIYVQLIESIGMENAKKVFNVFKGQQIAFPKRFYKQEYVVKNVIKRYNEENINELAREFDYTDRYLRKLISEYLKNTDSS